jgi:ABC-type uncharacterized transport system permease subunit
MMLNIKLLTASAVGAAGALKLWNEPGGWGIILNVIGALLLSWIIFVTVLYLTASRLRREPGETRKHRTVRIPSRAHVRYDRSGFTRISR